MLIAGMDPCFSCNDRMITTVDDTGVRQTWSWSDLRKHGIEYYQQ
jgi:NADH-quinone oxidoreductase subunit D